MADDLDGFNPEDFKPSEHEINPGDNGAEVVLADMETDDLRARVIDSIRNAKDPEGLREALSEAGPLTLGMLRMVALEGTHQMYQDMKDGKLKGQARAVNVGIAVDKMAKGGQLLQQLSPTRIIFEDHIDYPRPDGPGDKSGWDNPDYDPDAPDEPHEE